MRFLFPQALLVFLLFSLNHWCALKHGNYSPFAVGPLVSAATYDETHLYAVGPRRFLRDSTLTSEPDVYELRNVPSGFTLLHSIVVGGMAKVLGSLEWAWMISQGLFPALFWLLVYFSLGSATFAWAATLFPFGPRNALLLGGHAFIQPLELTRMPQPALSITVLMFSVFFLIRSLHQGRKKDLVLSGFFLGLTFYSYYYYWVGLYLTLGLLGLGFLVQQEWAYVRRIIGVGAVGAITGIPYFLRLSQASKLGQQQELMGRLGEFSRQVVPSGAVLFAVFALILGFFFYAPKWRWHEKKHLQLLVFLSVVTAGTLGLNFHLATGYNPQHSHFHTRLIQPFLFLVFSQLFLQLVERKRILWWGAFCGTFALIAMAGVRQVRVASFTLEDHRTNTPRREALRWIQEHLAPDTVVGTTDIELLTLLPPIAGTWNFVPVGGRSMATDEEILTRYLLVSKLEGRSLNSVLEDLQYHAPAEDRLWLHHSFVFFNRNALSEKITERTRSLWTTLDMKKELATRKLDYLLLPASAFAQTNPVYSNSAWKIVKFGG